MSLTSTLPRDYGAAPPQAEALWCSPNTPAEAEGFGRLTSNQSMWRYLHHLAATYPALVRLDQIGESTGGRPIFAVRVGAGEDDAAGAAGGAQSGAQSDHLRMVVFAQQHGNEPAGKEACLALIRDLAAGPLRPLLGKLVVWVIPQLNPDGAASQERLTACGSDLNRGHLLLRTPEHHALYGLFHRVLPHITVDLHEVNVEKTRRTCGMLARYDLMAEGPTNPNVGPALRDLGQRALAAVAERLAAGGLGYARYLIDALPRANSKRPRYSTLHAYDGRNLPSLFGAVGFIYEVTRHRTLTARLERRVHSCVAGVRALLEFAAGHAAEVEAAVAEWRAQRTAGANGAVALRTKYRPARHEPPLRYAYWRRDTGETGEVTLAEAHTEPAVTRQRVLPAAYWLDLDPHSAEWRALASIAEGHRLRLTRSPGFRARVQRYRLLEDRRSAPDKRRRAAVDVEEGEQDVPAGAVLLPCAQLGGLLAALLLEPESADGLLANRVWHTEPGSFYPVKRILGVVPEGAPGL